MKKIVLSLGICSIILISGCSAGYVSTRPADVVYARPVSPGPGYVWVSGEWVWNGGKYHWHEGSWSRPRNGQKWKSGYWESGHNGYRWHKGGWH